MTPELNSVTILEKLIAFPTVSRTPNTDLIDYVQTLLQAQGISTDLVTSADGNNANLHAHTGPRDKAGVMLSGHSDVVPVIGQQWSKEPFQLSQHDGKLYGRGTADMKGFIACAIHAMLKAAHADLQIPLQLALSYDEEIGCIGVRHLLDMLASAPCQPAFCIIGEPTELSVATGHKGKTALRATCTGKEAHSALAPSGLNAIHLATDLVNTLRHEQQWLQQSGARDDDYNVPYTTLHVGLINGGVALNIVPKECVVDFEIRNLQADDPALIIKRIKQTTEEIISVAREQHAEADIQIEIVNSYPGLDTAPDAEIVSFVKSLTGANSTNKVAYGTEGGLFQQRLGIPTVVCGPGSMNQGHKPDEYITQSQLDRCDAMLDVLIQRLSSQP